jgi:threonine/homoserine/homoserine lactone efflux protein
LRVVGFFAREIEVRLDVAGFGVESFFRVHAVFHLLALLQESLRLFLVLPEVGIAYFFFQSGELFSSGAGVKESSARARCVS